MPGGLEAARELIAAFKDATTSALACEILDRALSRGSTTIATRP